MWRDHSDEIQIVTNSSQMNISDNYGVFCDVRCIDDNIPISEVWLVKLAQILST
jgi:hypothetical protein